MDPDGLHAGVLGIEVIDPQEEPNTPGALLTDDRPMTATIAEVGVETACPLAVTDVPQ